MKRILSVIVLLMSIGATAQNVGVGETNPTESKLQVKTADSAVLLIQNTATAANTKTGLFFKTNSNYSGSIATVGSGATFRMGLFTFGGSSPSSLIERISISDAGNVGVGTTSPTAKLEVNGNLKLTGGSPGAGKFLISDPAGLASWFDASASLLPLGASGNTLRHTGIGWTANSLLYNNGTSIGIGTNTPNASYILDINGRPRLRHNGATAGMWYNKADNTEGAFTGMFNDTTYGYYGEFGWTSGFDVKNGRLGIGTLAPTAALSFNNTVGNKINLFGDAATPHYGIGIQGSLLQLYTSTSGADIAFGYGRSSSFAETMRIKGNGKVGIGGVSPTDYQLHVLGWPNSKLLQLENTDILDAGINNTITFQTGGQYTGAIKTIGEGTNAASLGFYTGTSGVETGLTRRMTIANSGKVTIGTNTVTAFPSSRLQVEDVDNTTSDRLLSFFINRTSTNGPYSFIEIGDYTGGAFSLVTGVRGFASSAVYNYGVNGFAQAAGGQQAYGIYGSSLQVGGGTAYAGYFQGTLAYTGSLFNASDATLKTNIKPFENALNSINKLKIKQYEFTKDSKKIINTAEGIHIGMLAQELQEVFPTLVNKQVQPIFENVKDGKGNEKREQTGSKEYLGVNYMELIPVLIKGMQEQQVMIEELKKKIEVLEKKAN